MKVFTLNGGCGVGVGQPITEKLKRSLGLFGGRREEGAQDLSQVSECQGHLWGKGRQFQVGSLPGT